MPYQEIELKLRLNDKRTLIKKLSEVGAVFVAKKLQRDQLFNSPHQDFYARDQALRLRIEKSDHEERGIFTFKGTPTFNEEGHKIRDEFETVVGDPTAMSEILIALGYTPADTIEKQRETYRIGSVAIEIDELTFGTFVELEGPSDEIESVRRQLELQDAAPLQENYIALQRAWQS